MITAIKHPKLPDFQLAESTQYAEVYLNNEKNILLARYLQNHTINLSIAKEFVDIVYPYIKAGAVVGITDATEAHVNISAEAREFYKSNKSIDNSIAHAIVVKELYARMMATLYIKFNKPQVPTKIFNDFNLAVKYLETFI